MECILRFTLGLANPALVQVDPDMGYRFKPDQDVVRFGKHIRYNQFSQRSEPVTATHQPGVFRVMLLGDSVLNGGNPIDQKDTISELLRARLINAGVRCETLAASAGGWGLGNRLGYLNKFGLMQSDLLVLEIGTNDLLQIFAPATVVDRDINFPSHRPALAIMDAWSRYAWPLYLHPAATRWWPTAFPPATIPAGEEDSPRNFPTNLHAVQSIVERARQRGEPCCVLYVPQKNDFFGGDPARPYEDQLFASLGADHIPVVNLLDQWAKLPPATVTKYFRDEMHLTVFGDQQVVDALAPAVLATAKSAPRANNALP